MMRLLLDTHIFLWFILGDARLSQTSVDAIRNQSNEIYLSVASVWEAAVKHRLGKLSLPSDPGIFIPDQRRAHQIQSLPLDEQSVSLLPRLPLLHRDPFDQMLICQAMAHGLTLVTVDPQIRRYATSLL